MNAAAKAEIGEYQLKLHRSYGYCTLVMLLRRKMRMGILKFGYMQVAALTSGSISRKCLDMIGKLDPSFMNVKECDKELLPHLIQVSINLDAKGNCQKCNVGPSNNWSNPSDFPVINPAFSSTDNKYIYSASSSGARQTLPHFPFDMVVKLNVINNAVHTWSVGPRRFIGEPIFVPKGIEDDDGYLLIVEYAVAIQRCHLVILDPRLIGEAGALVARLEVPRHLNFPLGFHGFWATDK